MTDAAAFHITKLARLLENIDSVTIFPDDVGYANRQAVGNFVQQLLSGLVPIAIAHTYLNAWDHGKA